jgi:hypothetical protein
MTDIIVERIWEIDNLLIVKTYEQSCATGRRIPNSNIYSVEEVDGESLNCFRTFREAKAYIKSNK